MPFEKYQSSQNQGNFPPSFSKAVIVTAFLIQSEHKLIFQQAAKYNCTTLPACSLVSYPSHTAFFSMWLTVAPSTANGFYLGSSPEPHEQLSP